MNKRGALELARSSSSRTRELESEFTPAQIANFKQAFGVFDINKDGRISIQEIFEVLHTMGNEVSAERQAKIREAVVAVDVDKSGDLDFPEFIQFMKLMDKFNKDEAQVAENDLADDRYLTRSKHNYFFCLPITNKPKRPEMPWWKKVYSVFVWFIVLINLLYAIAMIILSFVKIDFNHEQDWESGERDYLNMVVRYVRIGILGNFFFFLLFIIDPRKCAITFELFKDMGINDTKSNLVKYLLTHVFVLNLCASAIYIANVPGLDPDGQFIMDHLATLLPDAIQIVFTYIFLSPYLYFDNVSVPSSPGDVVKVLFADLLLFNIIRLIMHIGKMLLLVLTFPFTIVITLLLYMPCLGISAERDNFYGFYLRSLAKLVG